MNKSKNDIAWEQIFEKYHILDNLQIMNEYQYLRQISTHIGKPV